MISKNLINYTNPNENNFLNSNIKNGNFWLRPLYTFNYQLSNVKQKTNKNYFELIDIVWLEKDVFFAQRMNLDDLKKISNQTGGILFQRLSNILTPKNFFATLLMDEIKLMGILNITPDSFSDGGKNLDFKDAINHAHKMKDAGAHIIDVGGESTKPYAKKINMEDECSRILPIINSLAKKNVLVSADTRNSEVMKKAIYNGAKIINDISGMNDPNTAKIVAENNVSIVIMHMQGTPETMQVNPKYKFAPIDIFQYLESKVNMALSEGIKIENIAIDPGFGFGKSPKHNMEIISWLPLYQSLGVPVVLGASRKSTISMLSKNEPPNKRLGGSIAIANFSQILGLQILRVHDVAETYQALEISKRILSEF